jgi:hypothetical protein
MKLNATLAVSAVALLAACGGGSSGTSNNPTSPNTPRPVIISDEPTPSPSQNVITLQSYPDGSGALSSENVDLGGTNLSNIVIVTENVPAATEIISGALNLSVVPGTSQSNGNYYRVRRVGTSSNGSSLIVDSFGRNLNESGTEYTSISVVTVDVRDLGINSAGTILNGIPSGSFAYSGDASILDVAGNNGADGTFSMQANFDSKSATVAATFPATSTSPQYFFSANDITINTNTGNFSSGNALMGEAGVSPQSSSIHGYFAGSDAVGVHGVLFPNPAANELLLGAFYGSR